MRTTVEQLAKKCRHDALRMICAAGSGHIGGALSSMDIYIAILSIMGEGDRLVVSHGHSAAAVYAALGNFGYFDVEEAVASFRRKPPYEGHPSIEVNGVEWCSGSLGQGLSVGCGFALAKKLKGEEGRVFVVMGDGEQQKGQLAEAREFAVKQGLQNLVAVIDCNGLQACGKTEDIPFLQNKYAAGGWETVVVDGHDHASLCAALNGTLAPCCILAKTVMGKGIPEIENDYRYHGALPDKALLEKSLQRLAFTDKTRAEPPRTQRKYLVPTLSFTGGRQYDVPTDVRSALGTALADAAAHNPNIPMVAFDCDLEGSVKLTDFKRLRPDCFIECGIAEHNAATAAAAAAKSGMIAIHADFSMFNIAETYSQIRMADINKAPLKLFCTHAGLDVGEDGKTHQCIDYLSLLSNLYGFEVILPADANQADKAVHYALSVPHPVAVIGGRSKLPILSDEKGGALGFRYGKADWLCRGADAVVITYGNLVHRALAAARTLKEQGIAVGVLNMPTPLHLDADAVAMAAETGLVFTYEDHNVASGIAGGVARLLCERGIRCRFYALGVTHYGSSTAPDTLYAEQGLGVNNLVDTIKNNINK